MPLSEAEYQTLVTTLTETSATLLRLDASSTELAQAIRDGPDDRRRLEAVGKIAAALALVLLVSVGIVGVVALRTADAVRREAAEASAENCLSAVQFRADLHHAFDVAFDVIAKETGLPADAPAIGRAKAAIREAVPSEPDCMKRG